jgi:secreted trypsin-like serine protease
MTSLRRSLTLLAVIAAILAFSAAPSSAVVGGTNAGPNEFPAVAEITFGAFLCTGTLIAPNTVLSAGHCGSVTGAAVASPASWPPQLIDVRIGSNKPGQGERRPVQSVTLNPNYLLTSGYDISLLQLSQSSTMAPTQVAGAGERSTWTAGTLETIVGWGVTSEGGDLPDRLQAARVPVTTDSYCAGAYSDFDASTMVCAGFPQGGVDTCQGDSGGPMFGKTSAGALRVVGTTSFGEGCARPDRPGVYGRVADDTLRPWIAQNTGTGVSTGTSTKSRRAKRRAAKRRAAQRRAALTRRAAASLGTPR